MDFIQDFVRADGKHKLVALGAVGAWFMSIYFSKAGFSIESPNMTWVGWMLGILITIVELVFNDRRQKMSLTLILAGLLCYAYGVWTNVTGFWDASNPGVPFVPFTQASWMAWFVGLILEVLPEPLYMWAMGRGHEIDPIGSLSNFISGKFNSSEAPRQQNNQTFSAPASRNTSVPPPQYRTKDGAPQLHTQKPPASPLIREMFMQDKKNHKGE